MEYDKDKAVVFSIIEVEGICNKDRFVVDWDVDGFVDDCLIDGYVVDGFDNDCDVDGFVCA